jgi:hypothetical protein
MEQSAPVIWDTAQSIPGAKTDYPDMGCNNYVTVLLHDHV